MIMKNLAMSHRIEIYVRVCDVKFVYATCWELYMKFAQTCAMIRMSNNVNIRLMESCITLMRETERNVHQQDAR